MSTAVAARPAVGEIAPDFTLDSTAGTPVTLSMFRGSKNVLLAFFPLAFTSTCTAELCDFSTDFDRFTHSGAAVLPISVDSVPTLREFRAKHGLKLDLLSDFHRDVSRAYGVLLPDRFYSTRAYVLIDTRGVIRWMHVEANPGEKRSNEEVFAEIAKLG
ncbi:MAG TPA: redoxin domain-containing protein [Gemmatimonadaceae bacterium]|nr:redoxin domain-containing protein [Gemmatimonadaceae bacterium]